MPQGWGVLQIIMRGMRGEAARQKSLIPIKKANHKLPKLTVG